MSIGVSIWANQKPFSHGGAPALGKATGLSKLDRSRSSMNVPLLEQIMLHRNICIVQTCWHLEQSATCNNADSACLNPEADQLVVYPEIEL